LLIAYSLLVPHWVTADEFRRLEGLDLIMYGQMTAGSWIYIGTQGILQETYESTRRVASISATRYHERGGLPGSRDHLLHCLVEGGAMLAYQDQSVVTFDYGNNLRGQAFQANMDRAFDIGGFVPLFIWLLFFVKEIHAPLGRCSPSSRRQEGTWHVKPGDAVVVSDVGRLRLHPRVHHRPGALLPEQEHGADYAVKIPVSWPSSRPT
jgi:hypothetical protein